MAPLLCSALLPEEPFAAFLPVMMSHDGTSKGRARALAAVGFSTGGFYTETAQKQRPLFGGSDWLDCSCRVRAAHKREATLQHRHL